jgi:hypothetical protein
VSRFLHLIPAQPGWRVAAVYEDLDGEIIVDCEPVVAWAEVEDSEGGLVPILRNGWRERILWPLDDEDAFFAILAPGEEIDPVSEAWKRLIESYLQGQRERFEQFKGRGAA